MGFASTAAAVTGGFVPSKHKGAWAPTTAYSAGDSVTYGGEVYTANTDLSANTHHTTLTTEVVNHYVSDSGANNVTTTVTVPANTLKVGDLLISVLTGDTSPETGWTAIAETYVVGGDVHYLSYRMVTSADLSSNIVVTNGMTQSRYINYIIHLRRATYVSAKQGSSSSVDTYSPTYSTKIPVMGGATHHELFLVGSNAGAATNRAVTMDATTAALVNGTNFFDQVDTDGFKKITTMLVRNRTADTWHTPTLTNSPTGASTPTWDSVAVVLSPITSTIIDLADWTLSDGLTELLGGRLTSSFIPSMFVPPGLTLQHTYTTSQTLPTFDPEWVYVVAVGGGGGGVGAAGGYAGGGGACIQGWVKSAALTSVTIGAGGVGSANSASSRGGTTNAGPISAAGGGSGATGVGTAGHPWMGLGGAGWGAWMETSTYNSRFPDMMTSNAKYGFFRGGVTSGDDTATSGAGGVAMTNATAVGGKGNEGPGGGGGNTADGVGGSATFNGVTYAGGALGTGSGYAAGGGAGILGNGLPGNTAGSGAGGSGGLGGGGGGAGASATYVGGNGGNGCVLVYY